MNGVWSCDALYKARRLSCGVCPARGMRYTGTRMKFVQKTEAEKMREEMGDESGRTELGQVSLSLEEEENTLTGNGTRLVVGREARSTRTCNWLLLQGRE